ncbi:hypothetical protein SteCoe_37248 [Stentor coeruleus]|uniref:ATP-dependent DNA helicase n=1 Tax=Stentor coeruleus TaxID=5963 RepID=A0A1R2ANR3_9CILI|nr:hypothetical protein SteCoe_37248 [Stentor coeruleus]
MWIQDPCYIDSLKTYLPFYNFKKFKKSCKQKTITLPECSKIDFSILIDTDPRSNIFTRIQNIKSKQNINTTQADPSPIPLPIIEPSSPIINPQLSEIPSLSNEITQIRIEENKNLQDSIVVNNEIQIPQTNNIENPQENTRDYDETLENHIGGFVEEQLDEIFEENTRFNDKIQEIENKKPWNSEFEWESAINEMNQKIFGNMSFKNKQKEIINAVISKKDVFACLPTGGGKSLTYQLPTCYMDGVTIIITPLISLIQDQIQKIRDFGQEARFINTDVYNEIQSICHEIVTNKNVKFIFLTPERLLMNFLIRKLIKELDVGKRVNFFVIDEAHCICTYGRDFRTEYKKLNCLKDYYQEIPILCLTASVTQKEIQEITNCLKINPEYFIEGPYRANLYYEIIPKQKNPHSQLAELINSRYKNETGIIYFNNKKKCETLTQKLQDFYSIECIYFHSDLTLDQKSQKLKDWQDGKKKIIVATSAFGMGIDNNSVRFVIHYAMPKSLGEFYQESGRAGRDNKKSDCIILYKISDKRFLYYFLSNISSSQGRENSMMEIYKILEFCEDKNNCRKRLISNYFESDEEFTCNNMCDNCSYRQKHPNTYFYEVDHTINAKKITELLLVRNYEIWTYRQIINFFLGVTTKNNDLNSSPEFGSLKSKGLKVHDIERILLRMLTKKILKEFVRRIGLHDNVYIQLCENLNEWEKNSRIGLEYQVSIDDNINKNNEIELQNERNDEVIISDNESSDEVIEIVDIRQSDIINVIDLDDGKNNRVLDVIVSDDEVLVLPCKRARADAIFID